MSHNLKKGPYPTATMTTGRFYRRAVKNFLPMWVCIGLQAMCRPGNAFPLELWNCPVLVRDLDRRVRVFHNVCRHRGHLWLPNLVRWVAH
ncbi:MAG: hypothetical protein CM1200mP18_00960 [Gammaproteobacteria bacterium]|nr:MAG: hypothetical protein CM1200mP18_00960 [Gammaproteobacteria bacterium]